MTQFDLLREDHSMIDRVCHTVKDLFDFIDRHDTSREIRRAALLEIKTGDDVKRERYAVEGGFHWWNRYRSVQGTWYGWEEVYYYLEDGEWVEDVSNVFTDESRVMVDGIMYYLDEAADEE